MKTRIALLFSIATLIVSCGGSGVERKAKETMERTFKESAKDPKSIKFSNEEVMFSDDSLCIIHVDVIGKNMLGTEVTQKIEYVYLTSNNTAYETIQEIGENDIYLSQEAYDKQKTNKIYKELDYQKGLYYLASLLVSVEGRAVDEKNRDTEIKIPSLTGTGDWQLGEFINEFGESTGENYLYLLGKGVFSNSATTNSSLIASLNVTKDNFCFYLYEYNDNLVKGEGFFYFKIKDGSGKITEMRLYNDEHGRIKPSYNDEYYDVFMSILSQGGEIAISARNSRYSVDSEYMFKMDITGYDKAKKFLK